jgi:carboxyl-terminal processing protease
MRYVNPDDPAGDQKSSERRRNLWIALGVALTISLVCLVIACGVAFTTGGAVLTMLSRQHRLLLPMVGVPQPTPGTAVALSATALPTNEPTSAFEVITPSVAVVSTQSVPTSTESLAPTATPVFTPTQTALVTSTVALSQTERQINIFHDLWDAVNTYYIYPDFNGLDWKGVRAQYDLSITAGITDEVFYDLMRTVVLNLNDNHSYFLSPDEARQEEADYQGGGQYAGVGLVSDFNYDKHYAYVLQVLPDSPAMLAGIKAHDHILTIEGLPTIDSDGSPNMFRLRGTEGTTVTVSVRTPGDAPRELVLTRAKMSTLSPVEYRLLPGNARIGYILIPTLFEESIGARVRAALRDMTRRGRLNGLIVDMRINGGGAYPILMQNLGFFSSGVVGYLVDREGVRSSLNVKADRISNLQTVPMAILIGPSTQSYAEVFSGALQAKGRAKLVGQRSGGNIETLRLHEFEDGSQAWIAEETFKLPNGDNWEGDGLTPDVPVDKGWDEYTAENDPMITAAIEALSTSR